jgi:muramoyltetrapeptide carboxypeptidase
MAIIPPYLKKGDTIGILCPSGYMPYDKAETCIQVLQQWGYKVKVGNTLGHQFHYFSGTPEERLADLQQMLDDDSVQAILCARGGYGLTHLIDQIDFKKFKRRPKWLIGFSDITIIHAHVLRQLNIATLHAPMAAAFNDGEYNNEFVQSLKKAIAGKPSSYSCAPHIYNNPGTATGELVGGNLALLAHLLGTPSDVKTAGKILFIEDVGEYIYNVDRMLYQLQRAGKLDKLTGLIIGGFTDMKDTTISFGKTVDEAIHDIVKRYDFPIAFHFPVSHERENYALKIGVQHQLKVTKGKVTLKEIV